MMRFAAPLREYTDFIMSDTLSVPFQLPITHLGAAGLFVSPGIWRHVNRQMGEHVLMFVRSGVLHMQEEGRQFDVKPDEALLLRRGREHGGVSHEARSLRYFWMHFNTADSAGAPADNVLEIPQHVLVPRPERLEAMLRLLIGDHVRNVDSGLNRRLLMCLILSEVAQKAPPPAESEDYRLLANQGNAYIHRHFTEPISASDVAAAISCNPKYLARVYREFYQETMTQTIRSLRLEHAQHFLLQTNMTVNEVARECGFTHVSYFIKTFRESTAMTPEAFRRHYGLLNITT